MVDPKDPEPHKILIYNAQNNSEKSRDTSQVSGLFSQLN